MGKDLNWKLSLNSSLFLLFLLLSQSCKIPYEKKDITSKLKIENCPNSPSKQLSENLLQDFKKHHSLLRMKEMVLKDDLSKRNYISRYSVSYEPILGSLNFHFICMRPLMSAVLLDKTGKENKKFVITEDGDLFDYSYEDVLIEDTQKFISFPELRAQESEFSKEIKEQLVQLILNAPPLIKESLSEIHYSENNDLSFIMTVENLPITVLLGQKEWELKLEKLKRIAQFFENKKRMPSVINLSESKKVIVKF